MLGPVLSCYTIEQSAMLDSATHARDQEDWHLTRGEAEGQLQQVWPGSKLDERFSIDRFPGMAVTIVRALSPLGEVLAECTECGSIEPGANARSGAYNYVLNELRHAIRQPPAAVGLPFDLL